MDGLIKELGIIVAGIGGVCADYRRMLAGAGRQFWTFWLLFAAGGLVMLLLMATVPGCVYQKNLVTSKQNLHAVQLALERFSVDSPRGNYPVRIEQLFEDEYLLQMPRNPFTMLPMRWKVYGSYDEAASNPDSLSHGDFGYIPSTGRRKALSPVELAALDVKDVVSYNLVLY